MKKESILGSAVLDYIFCLVIAAAFLLVATEASPLYQISQWVDSNAFVTVGKSLAHGRVLYKEIFEQKGPFLYFIHTLAYWLSPARPFVGVYVAETVSFSVCLFFVAKITCLFLKRVYLFLTVPLFCAATLFSFCFVLGDSAEEFCLPFITAGLYLILRYFQRGYPAPIGRYALVGCGVLAGVILWIKYTLLGFWVGWMLGLIISAIAAGRYRHIVPCVLWFLFGMLIASLPVLFYVGLTNSLWNLYYTYFYINITAYTIHESGRFWGSVFENIWRCFYKNPLISVPWGLGLLLFWIKPKEKMCLWAKIALTASGLTALAATMVSEQVFDYYFLICAPFAALGVISVLEWAARTRMPKLIPGAAAPVICTGLWALTAVAHPNAHDLHKNREDLVQFVFADIIRETPGATLLNYDALDLGFYTAADIVPNVKFFMKQNIPYEKFPDNQDAQNQYLQEAKTDYVVLLTNNDTAENNAILNENYERIARREYSPYIEDYDYMLYKRRDKEEKTEASKDTDMILEN